MTKPLPKKTGIGTVYFAERKTWMAHWEPYHWGWRGWGDTEEEAIADLRRRDPYTAAEVDAKDRDHIAVPPS